MKPRRIIVVIFITASMSCLTQKEKTNEEFLTIFSPDKYELTDSAKICQKEGHKPSMSSWSISSEHAEIEPYYEYSIGKTVRVIPRGHIPQHTRCVRCGASITFYQEDYREVVFEEKPKIKQNVMIIDHIKINYSDSCSIIATEIIKSDTVVVVKKLETSVFEIKKGKELIVSRYETIEK